MAVPESATPIRAPLDANGAEVPVAVSGAISVSGVASELTSEDVRDKLNEIATILLRMSRLMESNQVVDTNQRQRVTVDSITTALTLTTLTTCASVTNIVAQAGFLGMDREFFINEARKTYNTGVRANLNWA